MERGEGDYVVDESEAFGSTAEGPGGPGGLAGYPTASPGPGPGPEALGGAGAQALGPPEKVVEIEYLPDKWSFTKADTAARCMKKAFFKYVLRLPERTHPALLIGRAAHKGQETDNLAKLRGEAMSPAQVLDAAVENLKVVGKENAVQVPVDRFALFHRRQLEVYELLGYRAKVRPVKGTVEATYQMDLELANPETSEAETPALIEGFVDVVTETAERKRVVLDYKTGDRPVYQKSIPGNFQFALQTVGARADGMQVVSFVGEGKQKPTTKMSEPEPLREQTLCRLLTFFRDTIRSFRRALKTGDWPKCAPHCIWCSQKACGYFERCYPEKTRAVRVMEVRPAGTLPPADWRNRVKAPRE